MTFRPATLIDKWGVPFFQGEIDDDGGGGSQTVEAVRFPIAFDTPDLVIPATGPVGVKIADLGVGDALAFYGGCYLSVVTAWDGTDPAIAFVVDSTRGDMPGTEPTSFDETLLGAADTAAVSSTEMFNAINSSLISGSGVRYARTATGLYAYVHDGVFSDPGSTMGAGEIVLTIIRAAG